jgi:uncharacterized ferritin-like protein (DUF455 family)
MEIREWALRILSADTLEEKLLDPGTLTDQNPGMPYVFQEPSRPVGMAFKRHSRKEKLPAFCEHKDPYKRAVCLHRFAGHELLAVEIMAQALLAFPDAPSYFRKGVAHTLREEQGHVQLYITHLNRLGLRFGDLSLYRHFWTHVPHLTSPIRYISAMSLTFEMANLDFAPLYKQSFHCAGDEESAQLMQRILDDEIGHVSFGWNWLKRLKSPAHTEWEAWTTALPSRIAPTRAIGLVLHEQYRRKAGISEHWIEQLRNCYQVKEAED